MQVVLAAVARLESVLRSGCDSIVVDLDVRLGCINVAVLLHVRGVAERAYALILRCFRPNLVRISAEREVRLSHILPVLNCLNLAQVHLAEVMLLKLAFLATQVVDRGAS